MVMPTPLGFMADNHLNVLNSYCGGLDTKDI